MIRTLYRAPDGTLDTNMTPEQALAALRATTGGLLWVDIAGEAMEQAEVILHDVFQFHPLAVDDALRETHVPKVDDWGDFVYVTLHSVTHEKDSWEALDTLEVDAFLGKGYMVSYESRPVECVERVWALVQRDLRHVERGAEHLLYLVADELVSDYFPVVEDIDDELDSLEDELLADPQQEEMERIFRLKRALAHLRRVLGPLREVMSRLARNSYAALDPESTVFFRDVYDHLVRLYDITESLRDLLSGTMDIYLSVVNNRLNQIMKVLTMVSTLVMPLTFVTGFFGMNFFAPAMDLHQWTGRAAFLATLLLIAGVPGAMYLWMRKRAWM
ncbi:MAG: magnesium/cobalt transporter CorA [Anaerolineae bacterium]